MTKFLLGKPVADAIYREIDEMDTSSCLALVRVGDDPSSVSYEKMLTKKAEEHGIKVEAHHFAEDVEEMKFFLELEKINMDENVHGILVFQPLPKQIHKKALLKIMSPTKDIDCITPANAAKIYSNHEVKFVPATAQSVLEILDFYEIDVKGKNVVIVGRSEVVGKPLALMLLHRHATVTIAHSHTQNLNELTKRADVVVLATGRAYAYGRTYFSPGQTVIDVGTSVDEDGHLMGDVDFNEVEPFVDAITPVPKGVGSVTTSVLLRAVCRAAEE